MSNEIKNTKGAIVKEINGVKYFKLQSPYPGDYTKNCGLLGPEIDENFFFLRSYDIESASVNENNDIVLTRVDGEELVIPAQEIGMPTFELVKDEGKLVITYPDGTVQELEGFLFEGNNVRVASDFTLKGDGRTSNPLRISEVERTGTYAPADFLVDLTDSANTMPDGDKLGKGARIVTKEYLTPFGLLYNYYGVEKIKEALEETGSKWRVPSRKDWAELLNAAEYCDDDRNHDTLEVNEWTGNWAGARAKAISSWEYSDKMEDGNPVVGIDNLPSTGSYGTFHLIPLGYGEGSRGPLDYDEDFDLEGMKLITSFWTSTPTGSQYTSPNPNVYTRTFSYETRKVLQESSKPSSRLSLRLVRDFDFDGFNEYENILGNNIPCVLVSNPDLKYNKVWTAINIGFTEPQYSGVSSSDWDELKNEEDRKIKELYYVNEWNGLEWVKKPMNVGDSIVILDYDGEPSTSGDTYHEWRIYETSAGTVELIDTAEALKEEFRKEIDEINERIDELSASTVEIREDLEDEIDRATSAETILAEAIEAEEARAISAETILQQEIDSIEVREVEPTDVNTFKSYNVFVNDEKRGATIDIPKDKNIKSISTGWSGSVIDEQTGEYTYEPASGDTEVIRVVYQIADGTYRLIEISIDDFIHENEFKDGLIVEDHVVKVLINPESDEYLTVDENGILLSGVTSRFNELQEELDNTQKGAGLADDGSYVPSEDSRYIESAESIHDATVILDDELDRVEQKLDDEIERSGRIDDNIAKDILGCLGNSGNGYTIDFFDAQWTPVSHDEAHDNHHNDVDEMPDPSGWTGYTYIILHEDGVEVGWYKLTSSHTYISNDKTVSDAIKTLDTNLKIESDRAIESENSISGTVNEFSASTVAEIARLDEKIDTEIERSISAETILQEEITAETERATASEELISNNLQQLSAVTIAEINRLDNRITSEEERAINKENELDAKIISLRSDTQSSANTLNNKINEETSRATSVEDTLRNDIDKEISRALSAETYISGAVTNEIARALQAESTIATDLQNEALTRYSADTNLNILIQGETARAMGSESRLEETINNETTRANDVERQLYLAIENEVNDRQNAVSDEITNRELADARLERMINSMLSGTTPALIAETIRATMAENAIRNDVFVLSASVETFSASTCEIIDDINERITEIDERTIEGEDAINVIFSGNTSTISLIINDSDDVLEQDMSGLKTTLNLDVDEDGKTVYLKGKNDAIISQIDSSLFVKDGMLDNVIFDSDTKKIIFIFNNDAEKENIEVSLNDLVTIYTVSAGSENYLTIEDFQVGVKVDVPNGLASKNSLDELASAATISADTLNTKIDTEVANAIASAATSADTLNTKIDELASAAATSADTLNTKIDTEVANAIASAATSADTLNTKINNEIIRATQREDELEAYIDSKVTEGKNSITTEYVGNKTIVGLKLNSNDKVLTEDINGLKANLSLNYVREDGKIYLKGKPENGENVTISEVDVTDFTDFKLIALTAAEIAQLPESTNIKEAYKLLNSTGGTLGDIIKIYKDSSLYNAYLGHVDDRITSETNPTVIPGTGSEALCFIYYKSNGTYELVAVNVEDFLQENEFKDGLTANSTTHEVSVKIDNDSESFLTVSPTGVKLSGVQNAINSAVNALNADVSGQSSDNHVKVQVVETNGKVTNVNVTTNDIASATAVTATINGLNADVSGKSADNHVKVQVIETSGKVSTVNVTTDDIASATALTNAISDTETSASTLNTKIDNLANSAATSADTLNNAITALTARVEALETAIANLGDTFYTMLKKALKSTTNEIGVTANDTAKTITISFNSPYVVGEHNNDSENDF